MLVTRRGKPVAEIVPPRPEASQGEWLGSLAGTARLADDLVAPAAQAEEWEALR